MSKKKSKKRLTLSVSMFKVTGASSKMKVDDRKKRNYYFKEKISSDEAKERAAKDAADILNSAIPNLQISKPQLKHDFYCIYEADMRMKFVRVRSEEISVNEEVSGVMVGKEIIEPKKGKGIPGKAVAIELLELFEVVRNDSRVLDGTSGAPARTMEKLLSGPGKSRATPAWIGKAKVSTGKFNSTEKVAREIAKLAAKKPKEAKRIVEHELVFKKLDGFYVPTYYVKAKLGQASQTMRVNAVNGAVSIVV